MLAVGHIFQILTIPLAVRKESYDPLQNLVLHQPLTEKNYIIQLMPDQYNIALLINYLIKL